MNCRRACLPWHRMVCFSISVLMPMVLCFDVCIASHLIFFLLSRVSNPRASAHRAAASHTLDDYRKSFNAFVADQPIVVNTVDTLDWVISSPPELHLVRSNA